MLEYIQGNIFDSPAQVIVNTVNTVGVMGKGLALSFKQRYPNMFEHYKKICEKKQFTIGKLMLFYEPDHWLLLFPTKENWRNPSKLEYIEKGLMKFVNSYAEKNITSIAFPKLGCGNGELDWSDVKPLMEKYLKPLPIDVYIYLGPLDGETPEHKNQGSTSDWLKANAKDLSFYGLKDDLENTCSTIIPLEITCDNVPYTVAYSNGLIFTNTQTKQEYIIDEESLFEIWDDIRTRSVFASSQSFCKKALLYELLNHLRYTTKIKVLDAKTNTMVDGYQINEGSNRVYSLKESV